LCAVVATILKCVAYLLEKLRLSLIIKVDIRLRRLVDQLLQSPLAFILRGEIEVTDPRPMKSDLREKRLRSITGCRALSLSFVKQILF